MEDVDFVKALFHNCSDIGMAARHGQIQKLKLLIAQGKDYCVCDNRGWFPIHEAVTNGHTECVKELVKAASSTNENINDIWQSPYNPFDGTALIMAVRQGYHDIIKILVPYCDSNKEAAEALFESAKNLKDLVYLFGCFPKFINGSLEFKINAPIFNAITNCCLDSLEFLISQKADLQVMDEFGRSPLHCAVLVLNNPIKSKMVNILLQTNCFVDAIDNEGFTPLFLAAQHNDLLLVNLLLNCNANPNICVSVDLKLSKPIKVCPIGIATENNYTDIVKVLAEKTDIHVMGKNGVLSPVIEAITNYNVECLTILLDNNFCLSGLLPYSSDTILPNKFYCRDQIINNVLPWEFYHSGKLYEILKLLIDNDIFLTQKFTSKHVFFSLINSNTSESVNVFQLLAMYGYVELIYLHWKINCLLEFLNFATLQEIPSLSNNIKVQQKVDLIVYYSYGEQCKCPIPSLKHLSRMFIRLHIFNLRSILHDVKRLPLPSSMIKYLMLES